MRILLVLFLICPSLQAMDRVTLERVISAKDEVVDACASFLKRLQSTPQVAQRPLQEQAPLFVELTESPPRSSSASPLLLGEAIVGKRIPDSPPKSPLEEEAVLGQRIPEMPTLFRITNKSSIGVHILAVLTYPYKPKKYFFQPGDTMIVMSPDPLKAQFQEVYVPQQEENTHIAQYVFRNSMYVRLVILKHSHIHKQLRIDKKGIV